MILAVKYIKYVQLRSMIFAVKEKYINNIDLEQIEDNIYI